MFVGTSIYNVTNKITKMPKPPAGRAMAARRSYLGKSAMDIENETSGLIYQKLIYRLENGDRSVTEITVDQYVALMKALEWTPEEFAQATGLDLPAAAGSYSRSTNISSEQGHVDIVVGENGARAPVQPVRIPAFDVGGIAAGLRGYEQQETPDRYMAFHPAEVPRGVPAEKLFMIRVGGDSMYEEDMARPIHEGDWIMVERTNVAVDGQIVVAYIPDLDVAVVKQYTRDEKTRNYLLRSYKIGGPTFWAQEHPDIRIQGVVRRLVYEY